MNVLSLFDGMSCGQIALNRIGLKPQNYFAAEIDKHAIKVTQENYPDTVQLGDVTQVTAKNLPQIDLLIGGSPCQGFSFAGKQLNFSDPRSALFFEFTRLIKECKPKYFLLENVIMKNEYQKVITEMLGVEPVEINSSLVSAQNRRRLYWTNIPGINQPGDRGIKLKYILQPFTDEKYVVTGKWLEWLKRNGKERIKKKFLSVNTEKGIRMTARKYANWNGNFVTCAASRGRYKVNGVRQDGKMKTKGLTSQELEFRKDEKTNCLTSVQKDNLIIEVDSKNIIDILNNTKVRRLTPVECERLQTVPDNYTSSVSDTQRYKMLGNGWTVDVICHILKNMEI